MEVFFFFEPVNGSIFWTPVSRKSWYCTIINQGRKQENAKISNKLELMTNTPPTQFSSSQEGINDPPPQTSEIGSAKKSVLA